MINLSSSKCGQNVYRMLHKIHLLNHTLGESHICEAKTSTQGQRELSEAFLVYCLHRIHTGSWKTWKVMECNNLFGRLVNVYVTARTI